jgi:hypothetical protein
LRAASGGDCRSAITSPAHVPISKRAVIPLNCALMGSVDSRIGAIDFQRRSIMAHTYEELKASTLVQLREIAAGMSDEAVKGYTQMNKDHLLAALCKAFGIDMHEHHQVVGLDKTGIKAQMRELKHKRDEALAAHDHDELKTVRRQMHHLKRQIHRATV